MPGAVGVLRGASPVVWLHDDTALGSVVAALGTAHEVGDVYSRSQVRVGVLEASGWRRTHVLRQVVLSLPREQEAPWHGVEELVATDVPAYIAGLQRAHDLTDAVIAACYPPDFLERARPVRLFGVRSGRRLLGAVATRRPFAGAQLFGLWVEPAERRRGIARALVSAAAAAEQRAGAAFLHAQVGDASQALMLALGWQDCGRWQHLERSTSPNG